MLGDIKLAARLLVKDRVFTAAAVLVLALGIAATNTVFTLLNGALLRELPFAQPERVVGILDVSYLEIQDWRTSARSFEAIAAVDMQAMNVSEDGVAAERVRGAYVSANAFTLLGREPLLGRDFRSEDERAGGTPVAMLGYDLWRIRYHSRPDIVGRTIRVNGVPSVVIGVMPAGFEFPTTANLWQPLTQLPTSTLGDRSARTLGGFGRLREGVTLQQARIDLRAIDARLARAYPNARRPDPPQVTVYRPGVGGPIVDVVLAMQGAVFFVLLVACANVANLLLARASGRAREVSVRMSLGASRWRIVRQLLVESLMLSLVAGVVALALTAASLEAFWQAITQVGDPPPFWLQFPIDAQVFTFLAVVCLGTAVSFGLVPALHTSRTNIVGVLNDGGHSTGGTSRRGRRWSGALVVSQLALALVLLTGAVLMMRNLLTMVRMDAGVDTSDLLQLRLDLPAPAYETPERRVLFARELEERLAGLTGIRGSLASFIPMTNAEIRGIRVDGRGDTLRATRPVVSLMTVGASYFDVLDVEPRAGRVFQRDDARPGRDVVIVNERLAALHFPGQEAVGRSLEISNPPEPATRWLTIVGVVPNIRQRRLENDVPDPIAYVPYAANPVQGFSILARSRADITTVTSRVREEVRAIDADIPLEIATVDGQLARIRWPLRIFGTMFAVFAGVAVFLSIVGLYAVTAYSVSQRRHEIGVRLALGAHARQIRWLVTRRGAAQLGVGVVLGSVGALAVTRVLPALLIGRSGTDLLTLAVVAALLVGVGLGACLVPARRATRLDPVSALRVE